MAANPIIERFTTEQGFVDLLYEIGIGDNERDRLVDDGFVSMRDLITQYEFKIEDFRSYLKTLNKTFGSIADNDERIYFAPPAMSKAIGVLHYGLVCYYGFHIIPDLGNITSRLASEYYKNYEDLKDLQTSQDESEIEVKVPDFKGASNWRAFRDFVMLKLRLIKGKGGIPIDYVIDETPRAATRANATRDLVDEIDITEDTIYRTRTVHFGKAFKEDNKRVWLYIKTLLLQTSAYDHIIEMDRTSNGRQAWLTLKSFYEGEDFQQRLQDEAFSILTNTVYRGESARFNFETYVNRHLKAHKLLLEAGYNNGYGMDESTKIQHLKSGIKLDAGLEHAITTSRTSGLLRGTFQAFVSFLSAEVDQKQARKRELRTPRVSSTRIKNRSRKPKDKPSDKPHDQPSEVVEGKTIYGKLYPREEWSQLSKAQRATAIRLGRRSRREKRAKSDHDIQISATQFQHEMKAMREAIVAGISHGSQEIPDDRIKDDASKYSSTSDLSPHSKMRAKSGNVGEFLSSNRSISGFSSTIISRKENMSSSLISKVVNDRGHGPQETSRLGADSHADISCAGRDARILEYIDGLTCNVQPFNDVYEPRKSVKLCNVAYGYQSKEGSTYILVVNQCLDFTNEMEHSLFSTNQVRSNGIIVDDVPRKIDVLKRSKQAVILPNENVTIPLSMHGPVPYIPVYYPSDDDMRNSIWLNLTGKEPWNPEDGIGDDFKIDFVGIDPMNVELNEAPSKDLHELLQNRIEVKAILHTVKGEMTPHRLSNLWNIGLKSAEKTLASSEQVSTSTFMGQLARRRNANNARGDHRKLSGYLSQFASDTFVSNVLSLRGNKYVQLFSNKANYIKVFPMKLKSDAPEMLKRFLREVGIPTEITTDGAKELTLTEWGKVCRNYSIKQKVTEPHSPWQNPAEAYGRIMKDRVRQMMKRNNVPVRLWDYTWEYIADLKCMTADDHYLLDGSTPYQKIHGYYPNITEYIQYSFFEWLWYYEPGEPMKEKIGRWLGPAKHVGDIHTSLVLTEKGNVKVRSTTRPLNKEENESPDIQRRKDDYTKEMESMIGNYSTSTIRNHERLEDDPYDHIFDNDMELDTTESQEYDEHGEVIKRPNVEDVMQSDPPFMEDVDEHIGVHIDLPSMGELKRGKIKSRKRNEKGELIGKSNSNPVLDTRLYMIEFEDGSYGEYTTNTIMENLYSQIDEEGQQNQIFKEIMSHKRNDDALSKEEGWHILPNGLRRRKVTTKGWDLLIQWRGGDESWVPMNIIKDSNPIELAEYAVRRGIQDEPAFAWWTPHVLKKRNHLIKRLRSKKAIKGNLKFGLKVPKTVQEAHTIDLENGNKMWDEAIKKELKNVLVAFHLLEDEESIPVGSKLIPYHIVFDVKFDLTRKARLVAGGHRNQDVPSHATYSSVVSRDSVRLMFLMAALNDLSILAADIGNAYLNAPCKERVHVKVGPELFGEENAGKIAVIVRALYGLKSAGASWRNHLSVAIQTELGFTSSKGDPDFYFKEKINSRGGAYYAYLIVYVDDILSVDCNPRESIDKIGMIFKIKKDSIEKPKIYLGANIREWNYQDETGEEFNTYAMGSNGYIKEAIRVVEERMNEYKLSYPTRKPKTPFTSSSYRPELENSNLCDTESVKLYQNLMGIFRWICELGRLDILLESSLLSQYMVAPRQGHLSQALNMINYLKKHDRSWIVFNPNKFDIEWCPIGEEAEPLERAALMSKIYPDAIDHEPPAMPKPRGKSVQITVFVDSDHAGNKLTRRSHTGILIFVNMTPVHWYSKRQNTVETSTFGAEFVALRTACELIDGLRYKLRMLGVPIEGPARVLCDNQAVVKNGSFPESVLKKKHCAVAYHYVRESIASGKILLYWEKSDSNLADLFTKVLNVDTRRRLIRGMLY